MTSTSGQANMADSPKHAATMVIQQVPQDAYLDEIIDALWAWGMTQPAGADACRLAEGRILAINPAELVLATRAARDVAIVGMSRQIALDVVDTLPEHASLDDILVSTTAWRWPDDDSA
jgi:hypothetical protein